jgi:hypothetical protein
MESKETAGSKSTRPESGRPEPSGLENSNLTRPAPPQSPLDAQDGGNDAGKASTRRDDDGNGKGSEKGLENLNVTRPSPPP